MVALQVRMLGPGRPFIVEISNARIIPASSEMAKLEIEINSLKEGWVSVSFNLSSLNFPNFLCNETMLGLNR